MKGGGQVSNLNKDDGRFVESAVLNHYDEIYLFILRRCGSEENAKDICQNTFMKLASSAKTYTEQGKIRAYLFKIAINCCNDYYRNEKNHLPLFSAENLAAESEKSPPHIAEAKEKQARVIKTLSKLTPAQKDILLLRYCHDMKPREIAACLSIPVATVKTRLSRAKKSFIKEWEND